MAREVQFTVKAPGADRVYHITPDDVRVVLERLAPEVYRRVKAIHFNDKGWVERKLAYTNRGRREIALCAQPPRMSMTPFLERGQTPEQFGARRGSQWPTLAIRRFLLYYVVLHQIGHLQVIDAAAKGGYQRFAREGKAREFAMLWCGRLWSTAFDHSDPVHNPPSADEAGGV